MHKGLEQTYFKFQNSLTLKKKHISLTSGYPAGLSMPMLTYPDARCLSFGLYLPLLSYFVLFLFVWFYSLRPSQQSFSYVGMGLPGLNQYWARINVSCSSDAREAWTCGPLVSSQALYHWATMLPFHTLCIEEAKALVRLNCTYVQVHLSLHCLPRW